MKMDISLISLALVVVLIYCIYKSSAKNDFFTRRGVNDVYPSSYVLAHFMSVLIGFEDGMSSFERIYKLFRDAK